MENKHYIINAVSLILESGKLINIILTNAEEITNIEQQRAIIVTGKQIGRAHV